MTTKVEVISMAIQLLGLPGISSLDEDNQFADVALAQYETVVKDIISQSNWRFATKQIRA